MQDSEQDRTFLGLTACSKDLGHPLGLSHQRSTWSNLEVAHGLLPMKIKNMDWQGSTKRGMQPALKNVKEKWANQGPLRN